MRSQHQALLRFNPNHYGPGPQGGQFAPAGEGGDGGVLDSGSAQPHVQTAQEPLFARPPVIPDDELPDFKEPIPNLSGKDGATDTPSWARGMRPRVGENGRDFAKRLLDDKYGPGKWKTGGREYKELQKYGDRHFRDPKSILLPDDNGA